MAFKKAIRRKRRKPSTRNKRKRKTIKRKKRALKKKMRKVPKKKQKKNKPRIRARKNSRKKTDSKKSDIARRFSKRIQNRNTLVRKKIIERRSPTGHTKKLVRRKSDKEQIVSRNTARKWTQSESCMSKMISIKNIERSKPSISCIKHINSTSNVNGSIPKNNYKKKKNCRTTVHQSIPESSCKNAIQRIRQMLRSKQSLKNGIRGTNNFKRCKPRRVLKNENAFYQQTVNNRGPREEQYEKYRRIEPLCHRPPDMPSLEKLPLNKPLFQPLMRNDMLVERHPVSENKSEEIHTNKPAASNIPNWLQEELNESTSLEPIGCSIRSSLPQNHYYEIQEVCYEHEGELQLINLRDIGLFDNFEAARESFIQNYFNKIRSGFKPVRSSDVSYPWLYEAIEASRNSIYGYWLRVSEPESGGIHEMFLRKKQWCSSSQAKGA